MTCPSCGGELVPGADRCPVCGVGGAPRVEGTLAKDPRLLTPPARPRGRSGDGPLREIPTLRKREKTWRDEVQERVRSRRQKRANAGLPLFEQAEASTPAPPPREEVPSTPAAPAPAAPAVPPAAEAPAAESPRDADFVPAGLSDAELADLPLQAEAFAAPEVEPRLPESPLPSAVRRAVPSLDDDALFGEGGLEGEVELAPPLAEPTPVERPARPAERARAALVDAVLFGALAAVVVYFAGRAARVGLEALVASWPGLVAYLALLALFYAGYFTGTTGQTPGKLMTGLRVLGANDRPPGYLRAAARGLVGVVGTALLGLGLLPMAFDPAGRAFHDRVFRTRVVRH